MFVNIIHTEDNFHILLLYDIFSQRICKVYAYYIDNTLFINYGETYHLLHKNTSPNNASPTTVPMATPMPTAIRIPEKEAYYKALILMATPSGT